MWWQLALVDRPLLACWHDPKLAAWIKPFLFQLYVFMFILCTYSVGVLDEQLLVVLDLVVWIPSLSGWERGVAEIIIVFSDMFHQTVRSRKRRWRRRGVVLCAASNSVVTARSWEEIKVATDAVYVAVSSYVQCCCNVNGKEPRATQGNIFTD